MVKTVLDKATNNDNDALSFVCAILAKFYSQEQRLRVDRKITHPIEAKSVAPSRATPTVKCFWNSAGLKTAWCLRII